MFRVICSLSNGLTIITGKIMTSLLIFMKGVLYFPSSTDVRVFTKIRLIHITVRWYNFDHLTQDMF